jgi:hypothetical protein
LAAIGFVLGSVGTRVWRRISILRRML